MGSDQRYRPRRRNEELVVSVGCGRLFCDGSWRVEVYSVWCDNGRCGVWESEQLIIIFFVYM